MKQIGAGALEETFMLRGPLESSLEMLENLDELHCPYAPGKTWRQTDTNSNNFKSFCTGCISIYIKKI